MRPRWTQMNTDKGAPYDVCVLRFRVPSHPRFLPKSEFSRQCRDAAFPSGCIADLRIGRWWRECGSSDQGWRAAGLETRDTADWDICVTDLGLCHTALVLAQLQLKKEKLNYE